MSSDWAVGLLLGLQKCFLLIMYMSCSWEAIFSSLVRLWESLRDRVLAESCKREQPMVWNGKGGRKGTFHSQLFGLFLTMLFPGSLQRKSRFFRFVRNNLCVTEGKSVDLHEGKLPFSLWCSKAAWISTNWHLLTGVNLRSAALHYALVERVWPETVWMKRELH